MEENVIAKPAVGVTRVGVARPLAGAEEKVPVRPMLAGVVYGEIVFWVIIGSITIGIVGLLMYLLTGGYFNSVNLLNQLWGGADCQTIWKEVGGASQPMSWYSCLGMLSKGDMLAMLGLAITGFAAVIGMWGAFVGMLRSKGGIYIIFALIIAIVLTLSAMGILKLQM
jgi:hypothetical protein